MSEIYDLMTLTGLSETEFSNILAQNPRAYMAVKGAVAEKHLEIYLAKLVDNRKIKSMKKANSDFDKDFYLTTNSNQTITLECKNVQVLNINNKNLFTLYFLFLIREEYVTIQTITGQDSEVTAAFFEEYMNKLPTKDIKEIYSGLPQEFKESSIPRYRFSASMLNCNTIIDRDTGSFLRQFDSLPLSIDFQRTRNSTDDTGDTRAQRLYRTDEIDIVGACLFSRTMKWEFVFGPKSSFTIHKNYPDRFSNKLVIDPNTWTDEIMNLVDNI